MFRYHLSLGSTKSGDSADDTHQFTGSLSISGSSISLGDGNNNVVLGNNVNLNVGGATNFTAVGYNAAGGNEGTGIGGQDITVVGANAGKMMQQNPHRTTLFGASAGAALNVGLENTFIGAYAGRYLTTADKNVFLGTYAGYATVDVDNAVIIGYQAGYANMTSAADGTIAIGYEASKALTSGANQVSIGYQAGKALTTGGYSTFIGYQAGLEHTGANNVAVGDRAFSSTNAGASSLASGKNVAIGNKALGGTFTDAQVDGTVAIGYYALGTATMGGLDYNVAIGHESQYSNGGGQNVTIGANTMRIADGTESGNVAIGTSVMDVLNNDGSDYNTVVGNYAVRGGTGVISHNTVMGYQGMDSVGNHSSIKNTFIGYDAGGGAYAGDVTGNVGIGYQSLHGLMNGANYNVALGYVALSVVTTGDTNIGIGVSAGTDITTGSDNTIVGSQAGVLMTTTSNTVLIGKSTGAAINSADADGTIAIGYEAGRLLTSGAGNTLMGYRAARSATDSVTGAVAIGYDAMYSNTDSAGNIAIGYFALRGGSGGSSRDYNIAIGQDAMRDANPHISVAIGYTAGQFLKDGAVGAIHVGHETGRFASGSGNVFMGYNAGKGGTTSAPYSTGTNNVAIGQQALTASRLVVQTPP